MSTSDLGTSSNRRRSISASARTRQANTGRAMSILGRPLKTSSTATQAAIHPADDIEQKAPGIGATLEPATADHHHDKPADDEKQIHAQL